MSEDKTPEEHRFYEAVNWLVNSHYMDPDALVALWGIAEGRWTPADADRGHLADGTRLADVPKEDA